MEPEVLIEIALFPDGSINTRATGPKAGRANVEWVLTKAWHGLMSQSESKPEAKVIEAAPAMPPRLPNGRK